MLAATGSYICIDRVNSKGEIIGQMLAYTELAVKKDDDEIFTVYGTLGGAEANKGGQTFTEYYLSLDRHERS